MYSGIIYDDYDNYVEYEPYEDFEENSYEAIREVLAPEYRSLPPEDIERILRQTFGKTVSPEDAEDIIRDVGRAFQQVGQAIEPVLPTVLPVAAGLAGTIIGGPALGAAAGTLTSVATQGMRQAQPSMGSTPQTVQASSSTPIASSPTSQPSAQPPTPVRQPTPQISNPSSTAIAQFFAALSQPQMVQALIAGMLSQSTVRVDNTEVPVGAFLNLLGVLINQAQVATAQSIARPATEEIPNYLMDVNGKLLADPVVPEQRAAVLWDLIQQTNQDSRSDKLQRKRRVDDSVWQTEEYEPSELDYAYQEVYEIWEEPYNWQEDTYESTEPEEDYELDELDDTYYEATDYDEMDEIDEVWEE